MKGPLNVKSLLFKISTPDTGMPDLKSVRSYLKERDYSFDTCYHVHIILEEILSAILEHSSSPENTYYLGINFSKENIEIKVTDTSGTLFNIPKICGFNTTDTSVLEHKGGLWKEIRKNIIEKTFHEKISKTNVSIVTLKAEKNQNFSA